jgi:hypothetical protein
MPPSPRKKQESQVGCRLLLATFKEHMDVFRESQYAARTVYSGREAALCDPLSKSKLWWLFVSAALPVTSAGFAPRDAGPLWRGTHAVRRLPPFYLSGYLDTFVMPLWDFIFLNFNFSSQIAFFFSTHLVRSHLEATRRILRLEAL